MQYFREAFNALGARRLQLFLATFGVGVGVAAMVFLVAIVAGIHRLVLEETRMAGTGLLEISVQQPRRTLTPQAPPIRLTRAAADALAFGGPLLSRTSVRRSISGQMARFGPNEVQPSLMAIDDTFVVLRRLRLGIGRMISQGDLVHRRRVVVLGAGVSRALFGEADPLGQTVQLGDWPFEVIGVLAWEVPPQDVERFSGADRLTYIPYSTAHETFVHPEQADAILVEIQDAALHEEAGAAVRSSLAHMHGLSETQAEWLRVFDSIEMTREINLIMFFLKLLVGIVGGISLFVGAVGVMNIMIVNVTQRTSEIGLRRAVGARASWIRRQFLVEAILITSIGGILGLVGAALLTWGIQQLPLDYEVPKPVVSWTTIAVALGVILLTGIAAGLTPAIRASRITPVEALRHE